jgi:hypothetical protein
MASGDRIESLVQDLAHFETRGHARRTLSEIGPAAEPALLDLLAAPDVPVNQRWAAVTLLAELKSQEAVPRLVALMKTEENLSGEAARALREITGLDIGEGVEAWEQALAAEAASGPDAAADENVPQGPLPETAGEEAAGPAEESGRQSAPPQLDLVQEALGHQAIEISWEEAGYAYVRVPTKGQRQQQILIDFGEHDADGNPAALIYTECGPCPEDVSELLAASNATLKFGTFGVETGDAGEDRVVMRHYIPLDEITTDTLRDIVMGMAAEADSLELAVHGKDTV